MISSAVFERRRVEAGPESPASASPDGLKTIRFHRGAEDIASADLDLGEPDDRRRADQLGDRLLVVLGVRLVEQADLLEEAVEATLDDLRQRRFGLALVAADRLERLAARGSTTSSGTSSRRSYFGRAKAMCTAMSWASSGGVRHLDQHGVDAPAALDVQVAVEDVARRRPRCGRRRRADVLLERDLQVVEGRRALGTAASPLACTAWPSVSASALN